MVWGSTISAICFQLRLSWITAHKKKAKARVQQNRCGLATLFAGFSLLAGLKSRLREPAVLRPSDR